MELTREQMTTYTQQLLNAFERQEYVSWKRMRRIVTSEEYLWKLQVLRIIDQRRDNYYRGEKWVGGLPFEKFIKLISKSKRWKFTDGKTKDNELPVKIEEGALLDVKHILNESEELSEYLKNLPARTELTMTIKLIVNDDDVKATVHWDSSLDYERLRSKDEKTKEMMYGHEHFNFRHEICPIVELEDDIVRKVSSFFDHQFPITKARSHQ